MKVVTAIDSFKGSLSSMQTGFAVAEGVKRVYSDAEIVVRPVADGGEGTVEALTEGMGGKKQIVKASNPLGEIIGCEYGIIEESKIAIIEMSAVAGITLIPDDRKNPLNTTTYGVGEIISDAIKKGCRKFIIGIGGSATNDGGVGMLQALGFGMLDECGNQVSFGANGLGELARITFENVIPELKECEFNIACDVKNPLCGENGCSAVFGPQKGADEEMIVNMDRWLLNYAKLSEKVSERADKDALGAGAAGGMGFAFMTFLNGKLKNGIELVLNETRLESYIKDADIVITGEGRLDSQTVMGKVPVGVSQLAKKYNKPVIAFSGCVTEDAGICNKYGIDAFFPVLRNVCTLEDAMNSGNAYRNVSFAAEQVFRLVKEFGKF